MDSKEPSEGAISQVVDFAGLHPQDDRSMVIQALKDNGGSVETVVMQYFDNPTNFRQKFSRLWNESMFSADRDGSDNNAGSSFHIESMNHNDIILGVTPPPEGCGPGAPSRPPSRSNDRSPLGRMVDWTAGGDIPGGSNAQSREDEDIQRALRESAQEAGVPLPQQESGIMDTTTSAPYFGPANRNDYDQDNWAMVPTESIVATAPSPEMRVRTAGAPAFLVQGVSSAGEHCLGGLLTILHEIPLARNILLRCGVNADSYGFNSEWWKGQEILPPRVLAQLRAGEVRWGERHAASPSCEEEMHRLMAFLDSTERSYGAVSVLMDLLPFSSVGPEKRLFEHLMQQGGDMMLPLTQVAALAHVYGDDECEEEARFGLLEMEHVRSEYAHIRTLYESLDHIMWNDVLSWGEMHGGSKMAMFRNMGDVLIMKVSGDGPEDSLEIPEELYPEKYLLSRKDEARRIQQGWCETKKATQRIAQGEQEVKEWHDGWNGPSLDKRETLAKVIGQWTAYRQYLESRGRFRGMEESGFDTDKYPDYRAAPSKMSEAELERQGGVDEVLQLAERALADMDNRLKALGSEMDQVRAKQRFLGKLLTVPDKPGRPKAMACKKFILRGIATHTDVVYVCQSSEPDLIELGGEPKARGQWWRLAYAPQDEAPVKTEKMEVERVLAEVWRETKTPLIIYATEEALNTPRTPLSAPLDRFVRADNKSFRQELREHESAAEVHRASRMEAISPSKRKHRADSADSMDSNRASLGSDDGVGLDKPFEREMADLSELGADLSEPEAAAAAAAADGEEPEPTAWSDGDVPQPSQPGPQQTLADKKGATPGEGQGAGDDGGAARGPEMQERARPLTLMAAAAGATPSSSSRRQHEDQPSTIDMELPDYHE